jgi:hypothetical protein
MNENIATLRKYFSHPVEILKEWLTSFGMVLVRPRPQTFRAIAGNSSGKLRSAVWWMVAFSCLLYLFSVMTSGVVLSPYPLILFMILTPTLTLFWAFCLYFVYRFLFRGTIYVYDGLVCAAACILIPINMVRAVLLLIPIAGPALSGLIFVYQGLLAIVAVYAITRLKILQAILLVLAGSLITAGVVYILTIIMLRLASLTTMLL